MMMKNLIALLIVIATIHSIVLNGQTITPSKTLSFDSDWRFHLGNGSDPSLDFNFRIANIFSKTGKAEGTAIDPKFSDTAWRMVCLPHDWAVELPFHEIKNFDVQSHGYKPVGGLFPETSVGWYRKHFTVPLSDSGHQFFLRFDGIFRDALVWINGFYLGRNESGYLGFTCNITDYLNFHGNNVVVVRVDATQYEGWFYEGAGIYRHVWLEERNTIYIPEGGVYVRSNLEKGEAEVTIETEVTNASLQHATCSVEAFLIDKRGEVIGADHVASLVLKSGSTEKAMQTIHVVNPELWSPDHPSRYKAVVVVKTGGKTTDSLTIRMGIKHVEFSADSGFFLNGEPVKIKGVCNHQDHAGIGLAMPDHLHYYRIGLLKQMGVNAFRTSHNAPTPELLDACDSLGMLVLDEQRLLNSSPEYMGQFERLIRRDRNHPSVFLWSIGNEEGYVQTNSIGKRIALSLISRQQQLDPSRTSTYGADLPNWFPGINEVIPIRGFNYRHKAVPEYHKSHPNQPILGTEMGSTVTTRGIYRKDTIRCYLPDQDLTAPWWASRAEEWWSECAAQPWFMGGFVWTGFDYRGEPTPFQWPNINSHFGILDMCGFPKNIYYYYQSWWSNQEVLHISPHWNQKVEKGTPVKVWINSNADAVELKLNGKSLGKQKMPRNGHLTWDVPWVPGRIEAIGQFGARSLTKAMETTGAPEKIILTASQKSLQSGIQDAVVVNISVVDKKGRWVPDASNLIHFKLKGDGTILGVGNGDPSSHEADKCNDNQWQRFLFNGHCQVILQAGKTTGTLTLEALADGLESATLEIPVH